MNVFIKRFSYDTDDKKAKRILDKYIKENEKLLSEIREIFNKEKTVTPQAFSDKDIFKDAPKLFDYIFHIMFLRIMMRISLGFSAINLSISYRNDIREFYESAIKVLQDTYGTCTDYLTEQGVLAKPPYITMPKEVEFIEEKNI